jgi:hypothetical protein
LLLEKPWEVNPADLFTEHLPSKDKIHQLTSLFGCEYRTGRAEGAPLLRPHDVAGQKDGHLLDDNVLPNFNVCEAELHNEKLLPHLYEADYINRTFPRLEAADAQPNIEDWIPGDTEGWESTEEEKESEATRRGHLRLADEKGKSPMFNEDEKGGPRKISGRGLLRLPAAKSELYKGRRQ